MKKSVVLLFGLAVIDLPAFAQEGVFKCTNADGVMVYQGTPCRAREQQVTLAEPRKREPEAVTADPASAKQTGEAATGEKRPLVAADGLTPGTSDTKVLNMRGWGRPQQITRSRGQDGFREEWTYVSRSDGATRLVSFVNGRVADVRSQDAQQVTQQVARAAVTKSEPVQIVQASPRQPDPSVDEASRATSAMQIVQGLVRENSPQTAAIAWERPRVAQSESTARTAPAPLEQSTGALQPQVPPMDSSARVESVRPPNADEPRREDLRTEPPRVVEEPVGSRPEAVVQSSAGGLVQYENAGAR